MEKRVCSKCDKEKHIKEFAFKCKPKGIKKPHCKECDKKARRIYYEDNKERIIDDILIRNKQIRKKILQFIFDYFLSHPCVDCGEKNPIVLEFDHRDGVEKTDCVSRIAGRNSSIENIQKEIDKCDVRCANCHKIRTAKQFNWYGCMNT